MLLQAFTVYYRVIQGYEGHCTQLNRLGNKLLVILSILEMTNMPLQFFLLSACTFLIASYFLTKKKTCCKTKCPGRY